MKTLTATITYNHKENSNATTSEIKHFYDEATDDYTFWSKDYNMHFGYYSMRRSNPFYRDTMLNEMNRQVLLRLQLSNDKQTLGDLGCGMGGTMRFLMKQLPLLYTLGVTLSDFQVQEGNKLLKGSKGVIVKENYENTSVKSNSLDGAVAMESFCHSGHSYTTLKEAYRILKPGKRLVITDAFIKKDASLLCLGSKMSYEGLCKKWSLDGLGEIHQVEKNLKEIGFSNVLVEDISLKVAPSVLHVPFAIPLFLIKQFFKNKKVKKQSWNNLIASFYSLTAGLHRNAFGYYIITAEK